MDDIVFMREGDRPSVKAVRGGGEAMSSLIGGKRRVL